jgi:hypothetical protein
VMVYSDDPSLAGLKIRTLLSSTIHNGVIALIHERAFTGPAVSTAQ